MSISVFCYLALWGCKIEIEVNIWKTLRPMRLKEMIAGVEGDRAALPDNIENREHVEKIFDEALELLARANQYDPAALC
jgi:3'-phosphoadenosine 5'-phosphosulfate sulfotransferase